jgi:hypothetical protein
MAGAPQAGVVKSLSSSQHWYGIILMFDEILGPVALPIKVNSEHANPPAVRKTELGTEL